MRKVAKKLREEAEIIESKKVEVRREDVALKPFEIPFQSAETNGPIGKDLLELNHFNLPRKKLHISNITVM